MKSATLDKETHSCPLLAVSRRCTFYHCSAPHTSQMSCFHSLVHIHTRLLDKPLSTCFSRTRLSTNRSLTSRMHDLDLDTQNKNRRGGRGGVEGVFFIYNSLLI